MNATDQPNAARGADGPSVQNRERNDIAAYLRRQALTHDSSKGVAEAVAAILSGVEQALVPILGQRGVAALYKRSLHLAGRSHPWFPTPEPGVPAAIDGAALTAALERQTAEHAAAAGAELLETLHTLLTTLIGASLTERLLRSVWAIFLSGRSAQDTTS